MTLLCRRLLRRDLPGSGLGFIISRQDPKSRRESVHPPPSRYPLRVCAVIAGKWKSWQNMWAVKNGYITSIRVKFMLLCWRNSKNNHFKFFSNIYTVTTYCFRTLGSSNSGEMFRSLSPRRIWPHTGWPSTGTSFYGSESGHHVHNPSCVILKIRSRYSDSNGRYTGF